MGRLVIWGRGEEAADVAASAVLARLAHHQQAEARAARALPGLLAARLRAGEGERVAEALRRWADGESAQQLCRWFEGEDGVGEWRPQIPPRGIPIGRGVERR
jgi:hypothetical protein